MRADPQSVDGDKAAGAPVVDGCSFEDTLPKLGAAAYNITFATTTA
jgi:hypothetical protein|eukprot:COSAG06_NODE_13740_length_1224_cov_1.387556_2_plen_46_part_00